MIAYFKDQILTEVTDNMLFIMSNSNRPITIEIVDDFEEGLIITDVRGVNDSMRIALWEMVNKFLAYTPSGEPSIHPDFTQVCPPQLLGRFVFKFKKG